MDAKEILTKINNARLLLQCHRPIEADNILLDLQEKLLDEGEKVDPDIRTGDIVKGPSLHEPGKVRAWRVLAISGSYVVAQNLAARKPFRHVLDVTQIEKLGVTAPAD